MFKRLAIGMAILLMSTTAFAFTAGKNYRLLTPVHSTGVPAPKIQVLEFFSYACHWCHKFDPAIEAWLNKRPKDVVFQRVPILFTPDELPLSKAYYAAVDLGVGNKVHEAMFDAVQSGNFSLSSEQDLYPFFKSAGISKKTFDNAMAFSMTIDEAIARGNQLSKDYQIAAVPTFIVNGQYETDSSNVGGDPAQMIQLLDFLVSKAQKIATSSASHS